VGAESREQRAESGERRAESRERRAESREQRAESREQRAESGEQRNETKVSPKFFDQVFRCFRFSLAKIFNKEQKTSDV